MAVDGGGRVEWLIDGGQLGVLGVRCGRPPEVAWGCVHQHKLVQAIFGRQLAQPIDSLFTEQLQGRGRVLLEDQPQQGSELGCALFLACLLLWLP